MIDRQTNWENKRDIQAAEYNQPQCISFPDHNCDQCHAQHVEEHDFNKWCDKCMYEKCSDCDGYGWHEDADDECKKCEGTGRIK